MTASDASPPAAISRDRWLLIGGLTACSLAMMWYGFAIGLLLPDMSEDLGLRRVQEGVLSSAFFLGQVLLTIPMSQLLSRFPPIRTMGVAYAGGAGLLLVAWLVPVYWVQVMVRFFIAVLFVTIQPVRTLLVGAWFRRDEIAFANSVFNSGFGLVQALAFLASGPLLALLGGWRAMMALFTALALAGAVAWAILGRRAPRPPVAAEGPLLASRPGVSPLRVMRRSQVWWLSLTGTGAGLTWATYITFWPAFARDHRGLTDGEIGLVLGCSAIAVIPGSLIAARVLRWFGGRLPFLVATTLIQIPAYGLLMATDQVVLLAIIAFCSGLTWLYFPILLTVPFEMEDMNDREIAVATAFFVTMNTAALTVGPLLAGVLGEWVSMRAVLIGIAFAPLMSTVGALLLGNEQAPAAPPDAPGESPLDLPPVASAAAPAG